MHLTVSFLRVIAVAGVIAAVAPSALAQDDNQSDWNHFGLDFRMGFNMRAKFTTGSGSSLPAPPPPSAGSAVNRKYNDGFVNVDSSHNAGGQTWNWGYQSASQVSGDTLLMHATAGSSGASETRNDDPNFGFEVTFVRDLGHETWGRWGLKAAFGYTDMQFRSSDPLSGNGQVITDTYQLHGIKPPVAPYSGSFNGPGAVIGSLPTRSIAAGATTITGSRSLDASLYDFRLGPTIALDIIKNLSVEASAGLALGVVDSTFTFSETAPNASSGTTHSTGFQAGAYAEAGLAYRVCHAASLIGGAQFQYLGDFNQSIAGSSAQLDLSQSVFVFLGFKYNF
ncbi:MAG TPA: hypothetical protein VN829_12105 [Dongiaceae bacterium]|nr:hypothetical protein [Dongiaceae bacterium]